MSRKVLIIDDMRPSRLVVQRILSPFKIELIEAENAKEGLACLKKHPDIMSIVMDIEMPDMNGLELLAIIKKEPTWATIPIMMASSTDDKEIVIAAIQAGANDYIVKPFSKKQFIEKMLRLIKAND